MRPNLLGMDMDFRVIPSAIPLQSPSPDRKTINVITPTISPNAIEIKKGSTPNKLTRTQKQNNKTIHEMETQLKYHSHSDHPSALKQKDDIIKNLKNIIDMITENSRHKKGSPEDQSELRNQVKILTIQNQKLVNIIDKMSKNKNHDESPKIVEYESKINDLIKTIKDNESFYNQEIKQLKRFNKSLNGQYKSLEVKKRELEIQNKKLLRVLKERNEGERFINDKMKLSETSEHSIDQKIQTMTTNKSQEKLSLIKIREQHSENLKALKEGLVKQIEETFDTMKIALEGINSKIIALGRRLESIQKMTWARIRKTHIERESITISIKEQQFQEGGETDRSFKLEKREHSEIYIQQGPSSSHERASRDEFARLEEIPSQKNLINTLEQQLNATKTQLSELRFKYDKLCLDTSSVAFSDRGRLEETSELQHRYSGALAQLERKEKEINILYGQIRQIEEQNLTKGNQKDGVREEYQERIRKIRAQQEKELEETQKQTEFKLKLLVENYEKELEILHKQIKSLSKPRESQPQSDPQSGSVDQNLAAKAQELSQKNEQLSQLLNSSQLEVQALEEKYQYESKILENALEEAQATLESHRARKEELQQQSLLLISEVNQHKNYIETLKYELSGKSQQFENMKNLSGESQENYRNQLENSKRLRQLLIERQNEILKYRKLLAQLQSSQILGHIHEIHQLLQKTTDIQKQITTYGEKKPSHLEDLIKERQQNQSLRQQLISKDELNTQLEARISQLQNLYQVTKNKLKEQQDLYVRLMEKMAENQRADAARKDELQREIIKFRSTLIDNEGIIKRIDEIKSFEEERLIEIQKILREPLPTGHSQ